MAEKLDAERFVLRALAPDIHQGFTQVLGQLTVAGGASETHFADTESEDSDTHLLVDWKGNGGRVSLVQQSIPFKQVKRRSSSKETHTPTSTPTTVDIVVPLAEEERVVAEPILDDAVRPVSKSEVTSRPKVVVSLSDSDVSASSKRAIRRPTNYINKAHRLNPPGTGNVVCLDSDSDSEQSFPRFRLAPCRASQQPMPLENVVDLDDEAENNILDDYGPIRTPPRVSSVDRDCTLDPFGSGRPTSPIRGGPAISSTSKRPASNLWHTEVVCGSEKALDFQDGDFLGGGNLRFTSLDSSGSLPNDPETADLNLDTNFSTLRGAGNLHNPLPEIRNAPDAQAGGIRKKRRTASDRVPMTEEEKEFERNEMWRAKEAERLRKAEEKAEMKRLKEEEKKRVQEENKRKREEEKQRKEAAKEEAKERRRLEHEKKRWENGKFALQNTRALIDTRIIENGVIGGHLLNKLADKQLQFQLVLNPCPRSIMWRLKRPSEDSSGEAASRFWNAEEPDSQTEGQSSKLVLEEVDVPYLLYVMEAEEFADMVGENTLHALIMSTQARYPGFTICFLVNKLKWYLNKKEQTHYKNGDTTWKRPPVEQAIARLVTHYNGVHSRLCLDEAEVAEHVTGLMKSLADSPFKAKSTSLSVSKNGDHVTTSDTFKEEIKKSSWLKALVALPHTPGAVALAVAKRYGTMRALLKAYLDSTMTVHQKEFLLQDLIREGVFGPEQQRRVGPVCSRRIYRIFMAQNGNLKTDDVEQGADRFDDSD